MGVWLSPWFLLKLCKGHNENLYKSQNFRFIVLGGRTGFFPLSTATGTELSKSR